MLALYVFSLIVGGGFLLVSLLGDAVDAEADVEVDVDVDMDGGVDADGDAGHASKILSIRTLVYALFGFGAVGTALSLWGPGPMVWNLVLALVGGVLSGGAVSTIFSYLDQTDTGGHPGEASLIGLSGTITLPLSGSAPGTVVVERGHRRITLRALPHAGPREGFEAWRSVVIVDMERGVARVAPVEEDLALEP